VVSMSQMIAEYPRRIRPVRTAVGRLGFAAALSLLFSGAACDSVPGEKFRAVQRDLFAAQERTRQLENELANQQQTVRDLGQRITNLSRVPGASLDVLVYPERISLASLSGGYREEGKPGDAGIVLYVQPIDRDQHVVKAAGTITVRLLDPQNPPDRVEFAQYHFDLEHTRALWYGSLMTNHFTVKCPWPAGHLPAHNEIVAYVTFTDLISGKPLTTTGTYKIQFPPQQTRPAAK
jgi:hypothetical protein